MIIDVPDVQGVNGSVVNEYLNPSTTRDKASPGRRWCGSLCRRRSEAGRMGWGRRIGMRVHTRADGLERARWWTRGTTMRRHHPRVRKGPVGMDILRETLGATIVIVVVTHIVDGGTSRPGPRGRARRECTRRSTLLGRFLFLARGRLWIRVVIPVRCSRFY